MKDVLQNFRICATYVFACWAFKAKAITIMEAKVEAMTMAIAMPIAKVNAEKAKDKGKEKAENKIKTANLCQRKL